MDLSWNMIVQSCTLFAEPQSFVTVMPSNDLARLPLGVKMRNTRPEHMSSGFPLITEELSPADERSFQITCKGRDRRKKCRHHEYASGKQVEALLRAYPDCDASEYRPNPYDSWFERPK
jgi:hypothetical protein